MMQRRAFRPRVDRLEGRALLSLGAGPVATTPAPGNDSMPQASWMALHDGYASRARTGHDDVVFLGDSITYLWGDPGRESAGSAAWREAFGPMHAANFGIVADQTQGVLWRVEHGELAGRPKVAVVLVGINNLGYGQSPAETAGGIAAVVGAIRAESPGTTVLLLGLLPTGAPGTPPMAEVAQVNAMIAGLDDGRDVRFLDIDGRFLGADGTRDSGLFLDGLHPDAAGYRVLADAISGPIRGLLGEPARVAPQPATTAPTPTTAPAGPIASPTGASGAAPIVAGPIWLGVTDQALALVAPDVLTPVHKRPRSD